MSQSQAELTYADDAPDAAPRPLRQTETPHRCGRGLFIAILGTDGSGKSTVLRGIEQEMGAHFSQMMRLRFPPLLRQAAGGGPVTDPHARPPRTWLTSVLRAVCYWYPQLLREYCFRIRPALHRGALILSNRHLLDAAVDPRRYRYGGPPALVRLMWKLLPKPDLVILLDAPPHVVRSRKQEVSPEETARQCRAYRHLLQHLPQGRIIDASLPLVEVIARTCHTIRYFPYRAAREPVSHGTGRDVPRPEGEPPATSETSVRPEAL
jgi:thymidylate kinase